ncbi:MAG: hypothetical protein WCI36_05605 [bacterium]
MEQKTKAVILILIILLLTTGVGIYIFKKNKIQTQAPTQEAQTENKQQAQAPNNGLLAEKPQPKKAESIKVTSIGGTVSQIAKDSIEITNGAAKIPLQITEQTPVILVEKGKTVVKKVSDIKKGDKVSVMINMENSTIASIQIGESAGSAI